MSYIGTQPVPQSLQSRQQFTGDGSTTTFATIGGVELYEDVFLNGVRLSRVDNEYSFDGTTLTITPAPANGDTVSIILRNDHSDLVALPITDSAGNNVLSESGGVVTLTADEANVGSNALVVDASGKVGIGTSSPSSSLAAGGIHVTDRIAVGGGSVGTPSLHTINDTNTGILFPAQDALGFSTGATERMRIDSSGNLLVGKESSTTSTEGVELKPDVSTGYALSVTGTSQRVAIFNRLTSDGELISFRKDGTVVGTISTNAYSLPSDRNFKKDISELEFGLDLVKKLKPKTYRYKINDDNSPFMIGLIAQDLEESLSEVGVNQNDCLILQYNENVEDGDSKYQLDYSKLIPVLIKATQEQQTIIESQQSQIDALTARIEALEAT